jgi:hypothetical protein
MFPTFQVVLAVVGCLTVAVFPAVVSSLLSLAYPPVAGVPAVASDPVVAVALLLLYSKSNILDCRTIGLRLSDM